MQNEMYTIIHWGYFMEKLFESQYYNYKVFYMRPTP